MKKVIIGALLWCTMLSGFSQQLSRGEYFFNTDPGYGKATPLSFQKSDTLRNDFTLNLPPQLSAGINVLYIRLGDDFTWSTLNASLFWVGAAPTKSISGEYFFDNDPGHDKGIPFSLTEEDSGFSKQLDIQVPALAPGEHTLFTRIKNEGGDWSTLQASKIQICPTGYGPVSDFTYSLQGNKVSFINITENATSYLWNFGNGTNSTQMNPTIRFAGAGLYNVVLTATNTCGSNKDSMEIAIGGIQSINPSRAPSSGVFIGKIRGAAFIPGTTTRISGPGGTVLEADTTHFISGTSLEAIFICDNLPVGSYDVTITLPGGSSLTLADGLIVEAPTPTVVWGQVIGPNEMLVNTWTNYTMVVGNPGNQTAFGIPVFLGVMDSVQAVMVTEFDSNYVANEFKSYNTTGFYKVNDTSINRSINIAYFLIPYIEPGSTATIKFRLKNPFSTDFEIVTGYGGPIYNKADGSYLYPGNIDLDNNVIEPHFNLCDPPSCIKCVLDILSFVPGPTGCALGIYGAGCTLYDDIRQKKNRKERLYDLITQVGTTAYSCAGGVDPSKVKSLFGAISVTMAETFTAYFDFKSKIDALNDCIECVKPKERTPIKMRFSWDPNEKRGPGGYTASRFTTLGTQYPYEIHFENEPSATAPASKVIIEDVLDTSRLNPATLRFLGYGFGDTTINFEETDSMFVSEVDLRPAKNTIVRVTGHLIEQHRLQFTFESFDPLTMAPVSVIDDGFLPPNINGTEGQGFVRFLIDANPNLTTGTLISNKASIIFDANPPIITSYWVNGIDKTKPESKVSPDFEKLNDSLYVIKWNGSDGHSGIRTFDIFISKNGAGYQRHLASSTLSDTLIIPVGANWRFYTIAADSSGNIENEPGIADLEITGILPVTWLSFNVKPHKNGALLKWETGVEINSSGFDVERSSDGSSFRKVGWVPSSNASRGNNQYTFFDIPGAGTHYYRLKQVDKDGRFSFSATRKVVIENVSLVQAIPNPFNNKLVLQVQKELKELSIVAADGKRMYTKERILPGSFTVNATLWTKGIYFIKAVDYYGKIQVITVRKE